MTTLKFTGDEIISDILDKLPEAAEIFQAHGLGCAGCGAGAFESLRDGARAHGFEEKEVLILIEDLNDASAEMKKG